MPRQKLLRSERRLANFARARIYDRYSRVDLSALSRSACLRASDDELADRSVLLTTQAQLLSAVAMIELDGLARRLVLAPPGLRAEHMQAIVEDAEVDSIVTDYEPRFEDIQPPSVFSIDLRLVGRAAPRQRKVDTQWVLLTSGTSGRPKMVVHSLSSLTGAIPQKAHPSASQVWATFYDVRRYGGLQIFLRAVLGGADLVLTSPDEPLDEQMARFSAAGVTSISGTPSHWRRVLMFRERGAFAPSYIRLSGEIADQPVLDALRSAFPGANIGHAYASTEAGVAFAVDDGREGFPSRLVEEPVDGVEMKVVDGALRIKSSRTASRYVGKSASPLVNSEGFVDTTDLVERRGDRYYFVGRRSGIINVGGLKVNPEEVETVLNGHAGVRMSRVVGRKNPVTGAIVVAEVVPCAPPMDEDALGRDILAHCQQQLEPHKRPAIIRFVENLNLSAAGKLKRETVQD